jgi:hypothetical protein
MRASRSFFRVGTVLLLLMERLLSMEPPLVEWEDFFGDGTTDVFESGHAVLQTSDGGYAVTGTTPISGTLDIYLVRTDDLGRVLWEQKIDIDQNDNSWSIEEAKDGGFILSGYTFTLGEGMLLDGYIIKTDPEGNLLWRSAYRGEGELATDAYIAGETQDGGCFLIGGLVSAAQEWNSYLVKTDGDGNLLWRRTYGGPFDEWPNFGQETADGGYILAGVTYASGAVDPDALLLKTDAEGNLSWEKTFGGPLYDEAICVHQTRDGGYILGGASSSFGTSGADAYLVKTDAGGNLTWQKTFDRRGDLSAYCVPQTADGGYVMAAMTISDPYWDSYLLKLDPSGEPVWELFANGDIAPVELLFVQQARDGGYIATGNYNFDLYLLKLEPDAPPTFQRGQVNDDGALNLTDAICLLDYLFTAGPADSPCKVGVPKCLDAADANDDGRVNISDPIAVLQHLFQGGPPPPKPFGACGPDETSDSLSCSSFAACP